MDVTGNTPSSASSGSRHRLRQWTKAIVYGLLLVNFGFYIADDWRIAAHTVHDGWTVLDWTAAFVTSIDEAAWFVLLFLFELETYLLSDEAFTRFRVALMHGIRLICYVFLAHTLFAYGNAALDLVGVSAEEGVTDLCQLVDGDVSFGSNIEYTVLDPDNCQTLSRDDRFYLIEQGSVVTDSRGLQIERELVWIDFFEAATWLLILLLIELVVRLQDRGVSSGPLIRTAINGKAVLYGLLWGAAAYWIYRGHYMYAWDEALWILGFMAIDGNLSEWRAEIEEEGQSAA